MVNKEFWKGKKVFLTGHTGFKGSWISIWLSSLGAEITGFSLSPVTKPSLFEICQVENLIYKSVIGDIRDYNALSEAMRISEPEIVIHMAAQPLVRESYKSPVETYMTNVMGTVNVFEAVRQCQSVMCVLNVTTDKCYDNKEWVWGYRETEPLGGYDPYSSSKACSELVTSAYRNSFFNNESRKVAVASARAGNVIGGGDWAADRLVPDSIRALLTDEIIQIRNPHSIRPWQHVLEPLSGYLMLLEKLFEEGSDYAEAWNFGPEESDAKPVESIVQMICTRWSNSNKGYEISVGDHPHEATYLKLDCSKSKKELGWQPKWCLEKSIDQIISFSKANPDKETLLDLCLSQIKEHQVS